jgi:hypothetical protein
LGVLPRNHKGAVIIEEFSGGGKDYIKTLTDVRSSNMVRIERVSGEIKAPAMVRMLTLSNQATQSNGQQIPLRSYPHGIKVLLDLIGASEDIARYDFFVLVDEPKGNQIISPLDEIDFEAYPKESYINRVRWAWSRSPEQIHMERSVQEYIVNKSNELNNEYNCHIKFFGTEAWKKLARVSIACAASCCSTDETGENIIVTQAHVDWASNFLVSCYDNQLFKLKEYVNQTRKYTECDEAAIKVMQETWNVHATILQQMEMSTEFSLAQLRNMSGLDSENFSGFINKMVEFNFVHYDDKITPSEKFRIAMREINRSSYLKKVGAE